jgi:DNA-binding response OmpR family regulator
VVEDDPELRELVREFLYEAGYLVETAPDGNHALECIEHTRVPTWL